MPVPASATSVARSWMAWPMACASSICAGAAAGHGRGQRPVLGEEFGYVQVQHRCSLRWPRPRRPAPVGGSGAKRVCGKGPDDTWSRPAFPAQPHSGTDWSTLPRSVTVAAIRPLFFLFVVVSRCLKLPLSRTSPPASTTPASSLCSPPSSACAPTKSQPRSSCWTTRHGALHRPLPQGSHRRPGRHGTAQPGSPPGLSARARRASRRHPGIHLATGQADARAAAGNRRRRHQAAPGRPVRALQAQAPHRAQIAREAAWNRWPTPSWPIRAAIRPRWPRST